jgi:UDP-3-O-[3-hydroxymyristoyl] glucosamine N-acyltransferase
MFAKFVKHIHTPRPPAPGIHASAVVADDARIGMNVSIGAGVVIGNGVVLEDRVVLYPNCVLYAEVTVGCGSVIHANSVLCEKTKIGANCIVYPGAVIGGDGFGHELQEDGTWFKIPQAGEVVIEDDVEIGCLTAIDKPALGKTIVNKGAKIDNLVQVGHGCRIGPHSIIVSQVGMAGGVKLGHHVILAGQVGIADHISIGDGARIGAKSGIPSDVEPGVVLMGYPVLPEREWKRLVVAERRLPELLRTVARLEARIAELETRLPKDQT